MSVDGLTACIDWFTSAILDEQDLNNYKIAQEDQVSFWTN